MGTESTPYAPGTLLLDFFEYQHWSPSGPKPLSYIPVTRVDRVGSMYYTLDAGGRTFRRGISNLNRRSIPLPADVPWLFPTEFSALSFVARLAHLPVLWCADQLGIPIPSGVYQFRDEVAGHVYSFPKRFPLRISGYVLREIRPNEAVRWFWAKSLSQLVLTLADRVAACEEVGSDHLSHLPLSITTPLGKGPGRSISLSPFPPEVQDADPHIVQVPFFAEVNLWVLRSKWPRPSTREEQDLTRWLNDRPDGATWLAFQEILFGTSNMYYTNDGIRWWRRLSNALKCEAERLRRNRHGSVLEAQ